MEAKQGIFISLSNSDACWFQRECITQKGVTIEDWMEKYYGKNFEASSRNI